MVISNRLNEEQQQFVKEITSKIATPRIDGYVGAKDAISYGGDPSFSIDDVDFNENMKYYLKLHKLRAEKKENRA